jgi:hypothetical protein
MTTEFFSFYLQNRVIQTNQTGGQQYRDTSPFSIPCPIALLVALFHWHQRKFYNIWPSYKLLFLFGCFGSSQCFFLSWHPQSFIFPSTLTLLAVTVLINLLTHGAATLSLTSLGSTPLGIVQKTQHSAKWHLMLTVFILIFCYFAECRYAEWRHVECRGTHDRHSDSLPWGLSFSASI